jgi:hypothetical protein
VSCVELVQLFELAASCPIAALPSAREGCDATRAAAAAASPQSDERALIRSALDCQSLSFALSLSSSLFKCCSAVATDRRTARQARVALMSQPPASRETKRRHSAGDSSAIQPFTDQQHALLIKQMAV